jgi:hypothetical protein
MRKNEYDKMNTNKDSENKPPQEPTLDDEIFNNQETAASKKPVKHLGQSEAAEPAGKQHLKKDTGRPAKQTKHVAFNDVNAIVIDEAYLGRVSEYPELIDQYFDAYLAGEDIPPIILEQGTNKLLEGFHRLQALKKIASLIEQGNLPKNKIPKVFNGRHIECEYVVVPEGVEPCIYSLHCNMRHGKTASSEDIKRAVQIQFRNKPGTSVQQLASFLGVSDDTARRYADEPLRERKQKIDAFVIKSDEEGKTQEEVEKSLKDMFPGARGTSRATISGILSENRKAQKLTKTEPDTNKTDTASGPVENDYLPADDENQKQEELPPESAPITSNPTSLIAEAPASSKVTELQAVNNDVAVEKARILQPSTPSVITQSPASIASWNPTFQVLIKDVSLKTPSSKEELFELEDKMRSIALKMKEDQGTLLLAGIYFRRFDKVWGPGINQIEALPTSFYVTGLKRFKKLVTKIKKEAKEDAEKAAEVAANDAKTQLTLVPEDI